MSALDRPLPDGCPGRVTTSYPYTTNRGVNDGKIVELANDEKRVLITNDKDFGELIFRLKKNHSGIVLLRLDDERPKNKIAVLEKLLISHSNRLAGNFLVVTETSIRIIELR